MVSGFQDAQDFAPAIGWELYQVTLDRCHMMFHFENGWQLLNVAYKISHTSSDGSVKYEYDMNGESYANQLGRLLRERVSRVFVQSERELALIFANGDRLIIHDHPHFLSWWFRPIDDPDFHAKAMAWSKSDVAGEED